MKFKEIKVLSDEDLKKQLEEAYQAYFKLRFDAATKQLKNHRDIPKIKKTIARIKTEMRQRELGIKQDK